MVEGEAEERQTAVDEVKTATAAMAVQAVCYHHVRCSLRRFHRRLSPVHWPFLGFAPPLHPRSSSL